MNSEGFVTEIPASLKRLVRLVMRGFYSIEHAIVMDMLIRNPCMKEDDLVQLLQFERKQLRAVTTQLKNDRFIKIRLRMETAEGGKTTRHNLYYINYKLFVNVVKYKLDHMRRKIETEERDSTSRASFKCTSCLKTFTDLEADQLFDSVMNDFRCSFCNEPVVDDESALPKTNSRLLLARFNEQMEPLYNLLRDVDDVKLAPELLEPELTDLASVKNDANSQRNRQQFPNAGGINEHSTWSGDATRNRSYMGVDQTITVSLDDLNSSENTNTFQEKKEQPIWMLQSTVKQDREIADFSSGLTETEKAVSMTTETYNPRKVKDDDIMEALLAYERKTSDSNPVIPGQGSNEESSSESEENFKNIPQESNVEEMEVNESDDEDTIMVQVGDQRIPLSDISEEHISKMTSEEKENYIRLTQDLYASYYE